MKEKGYGPVLLMKKKRTWTPLQNEQGCSFDFLGVKKAVYVPQGVNCMVSFRALRQKKMI